MRLLKYNMKTMSCVTKFISQQNKLTKKYFTTLLTRLIYLIFVCGIPSLPPGVPPIITFNFYLLNKSNPTKVEVDSKSKEGRSTREGALSLVF